MNQKPEPDIDFDNEYDRYCPNCGGDGVVYSCFEEYACVDPEGGCGLCERRCDWCNPPKPKNPQQPETGSD